MRAKFGRRQFLFASAGAALLPKAGANARSSKFGELSVTGLKVDYIDRPLGLENPRPRLSWRIESNRRNVSQIAYRVLVATKKELLRDGRAILWDTGKIRSRRSFNIEYVGRQLTSRLRCWWQVQVWDDSGATAQSEPSWWEMGLLKASDWTARWLAVEDSVAKVNREIGLKWIWGQGFVAKRSYKFRSEFSVPSEVRGGKLLVTNYRPAKAIGVWIDDVEVVNATANDWLPLSPINAGEHVIYVEVHRPDAESSAPDATQPTHGLAVFACFESKNGTIVRIGSDLTWKASTAVGVDWRKQAGNEVDWHPVVPARVDGYQPWPPQPAMHLRRVFLVSRRFLRARLYATALGVYEARLNGKRIGDALLTPEPSQYDKRALYRVYDVTRMLNQGSNVLALTVGDGWYASFDGHFTWGAPPRRVLAQLELEFVDGARQIVATGPGWRIAQSPILRSEIRRGETYDARLELTGWDAAEFDDSQWLEAEPADNPQCQLVAQVSPPVRVTQILKPCALTQPSPGVYVIDFGQNFAGWCRLHVKGPSGTRVNLRFAELITSSGHIDQSSMGYYGIGAVEPKADVFVLKGSSSEEIFEPRFTYRGFRYVELTGLHAAPNLQSIEGVVAHSDLGFVSELRIDAPMLEKLWRNAVWTQRSNFVAIPTDCPTREQRGWLADAGIFWDSAAFNMDVCAFTSRHLDNITDCQFDDGAFGPIAPTPKVRNSAHHAGATPAWSDAAIILPWVVWSRYGDTSIIEKNWHAMTRYIQFIMDHNPDFVWRNHRGMDFGDWLAIGETPFFIDPKTTPTTPKDLIATAYWAYSVNLLSRMATAIKRTLEAERLRQLFLSIREAFNVNFVRADGTVGNGSQTSYILALKFNLLSEDLAAVAANKLAANIHSQEVSLTTGILGTQFILDVLVDAGLTDLAYSLLLKTKFPSWGHMIINGATTILESWQGSQGIRAKSQNHFALGSVCGFLFRRIIGISEATPGFETVDICPVPNERIRFASGQYESIMGRIFTRWVLTAGGRFTLDVSIPANSVAIVHLPIKQGSRIEEGGDEISLREDLSIVSRLAHEVTIKIGSGDYRFEVIG